MAPFDNVKNRPTADLVVLFLCALIGIYLVVSMVFLVVTQINHDDQSAALLINRLGAIVNSIVGAVIGFVGGRGVGDTEGFNRGLTYNEPEHPTPNERTPVDRAGRRRDDD